MPVSQVFSDEMWTELKALMVAQGWDVEATEALWASDFSKVRQRQAEGEQGCVPRLGGQPSDEKDHKKMVEIQGAARN